MKSTPTAPDKATDQKMFDRACMHLKRSFPNRIGNEHRLKQYQNRRKFYETHGELPKQFNFKV
ncbi:hypothetical protein [Hahella ganghwensis]|uniref:hypothetical protein n=1 Tax=Hahella ganghwensis TaxID=286420 RepID=UPI000382A097|nr:hypothetical protein [Hahella ganghwensis]